MKTRHKRLLSLSISAILCGLVGLPAAAFVADSEVPLTTTIGAVSTGNTPSGIAVDSATDTLFVTNADDNNVSVIDGINNSVIDTVSVGEMPLGIALNSGKTLAYIANFSSGTVSVIDTATNDVVNTIETGGSPTQVAVTPDDSQVFVTDAQHDRIHIIDTATGQARDITIGAETEGIAISPDGQYVYATAFLSDAIAVFAADTGALVDAIYYPEVEEAADMFAPRGIAISHDGSTAYVAESAKNSVGVIDLTTNEIVRHISVGAGPSNVALTADGRIISSNTNGDTISIVSDSNVVELPSSGSPWSIGTSSEKDRIYVTALDTNEVSVIADLALVSQPESFVVSAGQNLTSTAPSITGAPSGSDLLFSTSDLPAGLSIDSATGVISGVAEIAQAATTYDVTATYAGQQIPGTHRVTIEVTPGLTPAAQDIVVEVGEEITSQALSPVGFPADNSTVFSAEGLPSWLSLDPQTGVITGTSDIARARSEYKITATNGSLTATATVAITVTSDVTPVLSLSSSTVIQGENLTVTISNAPVGSVFDISLHSDPLTLGTITIGEDTKGSADFTIPAEAATGVHTIVATYEDYSLTQEITVVGSQTTPEAGNTTTTNTPNENLAETGINLPVIAAIAAAACALLAVGVIMVNRARKQS